MSLSPAERETIIQTDDESRTWCICTYQSKIINRLRKVGIEPVKTDEDGGHFYYNIPFNQVSFRSKSTRKPMSEEQKEAARNRLEKAREESAKGTNKATRVNN